MSWPALALSSIYGICICMRRGTKQQQLVALIALPTFAPIAAASFTILYLIGYLG